MDQNLELLYKGALADGQLTKQEIEILLKKATESGENVDSFKKKLLEDFIESVFEKGDGQERKKEVLGIVKLLGLDIAEYSMLIDGKIGSKQLDENKSGKAFVQALKNEIKGIAIYAPTGKYGKLELDGDETGRKKAEIVLLADPQSPSEIYEYLMYAVSLDFIKYKDARVKIKALLNESLRKFPANIQIEQARKDIEQSFRKYYASRILCVLIPVLSIAIYFGFFWLNIHWGWKILWGLLALYLVISLSIIPVIHLVEKYDQQLKDAFK